MLRCTDGIYAECRLSNVSFMLNVEIKSVVPNAEMPNAEMPNAVIPSDVMLSVI